MAIVELPTVILAVGSLQDDLRSDFLFACTFFVFRILLNVFAIVSLKRHHPIKALWVVSVGMLMLHLYWFHRIVCTQVRKYTSGVAQARAGKKQGGMDDMVSEVA
ncbi:hypothetical protein DFQ28_006009 [Apophysomyces sp. BC1034]|nr:hypothetical protein DFQ29_004221 [Apophysomyces sp. BC1021]KAG0193228.1 hypothetical protein DFQ28_006009 [Apophysomyces sp. BC1034]